MVASDGERNNKTCKYGYLDFYDLAETEGAEACELGIGGSCPCDKWEPEGGRDDSRT